MANSIDRRSNRVPKSPKSYRRAFARTVRRHAKNVAASRPVAKRIFQNVQ